ncbi:MAG: flagellar motor stator protein MotA [candidate division Zixibacteria bacterium 4484_95]|nr:MAG: flagellar motor stator protein MotA [candidate division Zixibacteria bacterium 4484_95]
MLTIVGMAVVAIAVIGGFIMEGGHLLVLFQPAEFLIIGGASIGIILISLPMKVVKLMIAQIMGTLGSPPSKESYVRLLVMLYEIFQAARKDGLVAMESHVEKPDESKILKKYPEFLANHHLLSFFVDTMRLILTGGVPAQDLEALIDSDMETHHTEVARPPNALSKLGDSLPGLGIVAAVLGVVITMGAIGGPPEEIGHKVGAALVGTFLGILLSYGFVQPLATNMENMNVERSKYYMVIKQALLGFHKGMAPSIAVEFARRSIPSDVRPGFIELEDACKATREKS